MNDREHILRDFDSALKAIKSSVLTMAAIARDNLDKAVAGLIERNPSLCSEAIIEDEEVNDYERTIDKEGMDILLRFSPVATDLRSVVTTMKTATNLERIADQAENIARRSRKILKKNEVPEIKLVSPVYSLTADMVRDAIRAFADGNVVLAQTLAERDKQLDKLHGKTIKELTRAIEYDSANVRTYLNLIFIIRCLERAGDHAVNIGEDTIYMSEATDVRHTGSPVPDEDY